VGARNWGQSLLYANKLGPKAFTLVDLGHHLPNANIEQIVALLMMEEKLAGFHFNDSKYGDDDLTVGSIKPYQLFLIFNELVEGMDARGLNHATDLGWMIDASHNVKDPLEDWHYLFCEMYNIDPSVLGWRVRCQLNKSALYEYNVRMRLIKERIESDFPEMTVLYTPESVGIIDIFMEDCRLDNKEENDEESEDDTEDGEGVDEISRNKQSQESESSYEDFDPVCETDNNFRNNESILLDNKCKPYVYIDDIIKAIAIVLEKQQNIKNKYNISNIIDIKISDYIELSKSIKSELFMISNTNIINWKKQNVTGGLG
jgi:hypothetical protein